MGFASFWLNRNLIDDTKNYLTIQVTTFKLLNLCYLYQKSGMVTHFYIETN